jgi:integrase/recombinase XerC
MIDLIDGYLDWLRVRGCSARTIGARREILTRIDHDLPFGIDRASAEELKGWLYRDDWSPATKSTYYGAIRGLFVWATDPRRPILDYDPSALLPRPKVHRGLPKPVTDDQLTRILTQARDPYLTWALLASYEGLRCCEIAGLRREHVTEETTTVVRGKGGRPGAVPTHPAVWRHVRDRPPGPLAVTHTGEPASGRYVSLHALLYFTRTLGMAGVSMHRLRHWYGTTIYRRTRDLRRTQELLRHASPTTTAIYTLVSDEERSAAIRALPTFTEN